MSDPVESDASSLFEDMMDTDDREETCSDVRPRREFHLHHPSSRRTVAFLGGFTLFNLAESREFKYLVMLLTWFSSHRNLRVNSYIQTCKLLILQIYFNALSLQDSVGLIHYVAPCSSVQYPNCVPGRRGQNKHVSRI